MRTQDIEYRADGIRMIGQYVVDESTRTVIVRCHGPPNHCGGAGSAIGSQTNVKVSADAVRGRVVSASNVNAPARTAAGFFICTAVVQLSRPAPGCTSLRAARCARQRPRASRVSCWTILL